MGLLDSIVLRLMAGVYLGDSDWLGLVTQVTQDLRKRPGTFDLVSILKGLANQRIIARAQKRWSSPPDEVVRSIQTNLADKLQGIVAETPGQRAMVVNLTQGANKRIDNYKEDLQHSVRVEKVRVQAEKESKPVVWVAERNACPLCLDLAGAVATKGEDFQGMGLLEEVTTASTPPRHPNCRCELKVLESPAYAQSLQREAARSAALGMSDYASKAKIQQLADQVFKQPPVPLPKSVLSQARQLAKGEGERLTLAELKPIPPRNKGRSN